MPGITHKRGFTLIELSIVLVIVALMVGSILVGQSMIRQSQVMSIIVDEDKYVKAAKSFRDKYNALPGDITTATSLWGARSGGCATATTGAGTCNGNGNGLIDSDDGYYFSSTIYYETFTAWQHLQLAGFIQGSYTGSTASGGSADQEPGINVPASKIPHAGFQWAYFNSSGVYAGNTSGIFYNIASYQQYLWFGAAGSNGDLSKPALTSAEALSLDSKIDDGYPSTGYIFGSSTAACSKTYTNPTTGVTLPVYVTTGSSVAACSLMFTVKW